MKAVTLTRKQLSFIDHYVTCRNGAEAARLAGYSVKTARQIATENLSKPYIQAAIAEKQDELKHKMDIDKNRVIGELRGAIVVAKENQDAGTMLRGWCEISKMLGLYAPKKVKVDVQTSSMGRALMSKYDSMSDEKLLAIMEGKLVLT
jgi:phage terminase small subunit